MKSYKLDDYEGEITNVFLEKLTKKLNERGMVILKHLISIFQIKILIKIHTFSLTD